jgi:hypothetical protein
LPRSVESVAIAPHPASAGTRGGERPPLAAHPDLDLDDLAVLRDASGLDSAVKPHRLAVHAPSVVGPHRGLRPHVQVEVLGRAADLGRPRVADLDRATRSLAHQEREPALPTGLHGGDQPRWRNPVLDLRPRLDVDVLKRVALGALERPAHAHELAVARERRPGEMRAPSVPDDDPGLELGLEPQRERDGLSRTIGPGRRRTLVARRVGGRRLEVESAVAEALVVDACLQLAVLDRRREGQPVAGAALAAHLDLPGRNAGAEIVGLDRDQGGVIGVGREEGCAWAGIVVAKRHRRSRQARILVASCVSKPELQGVRPRCRELDVLQRVDVTCGHRAVRALRGPQRRWAEVPLGTGAPTFTGLFVQLIVKSLVGRQPSPPSTDRFCGASGGELSM